MRFIVACLLFWFMSPSIVLAAGEVNELKPDDLYQMGDTYYESGEPKGYLIKFSVFVKNGQVEKILYQNTREYKLHYHYLATLPEFKGFTSQKFDKIALYENNDRRLYLGTLVAISDYMSTQHKIRITFDVAGIDPIPADKILDVTTILKKSLVGEQMHLTAYHPTRNQIDYVKAHENEFKILKDKLDVAVGYPVSPSTIQIYAAGWQVGKLTRFPKLNAKEGDDEYAARIFAAYSEGKLNTESIVLLDAIPRDLPPLAGILSATVSSPNSHPALLAPLFGTVIAFTPNALENKTWNQWAKKGESVYLKISTKWEDSAAEIYLSKVSSVDEYQRLIEVKKSSRVTVGELKIDRKTSKIVPTFELSSDMIPAYGAKSANFGFLQQLFKGEDVTVDGLGIPVYFQSEFFNNAHISADLKLSDYITKQIAVASSADTTVAEIVSILEDVRNKILQAEVPQALLEQMNTALNNAYPDKTTTLFLRSSANVEDLKGFNGAGLYDSKKLKVRDNLAELANAIKVVWASPYKFNAFMARKNSQIDESKVGMAVLVNPFLQNVRSQGVISTTEPRREYDEFRMNLVGMFGTQYSVTDPPPGIKPEITRVYRDRYSDEVRINLAQYNDLLPDVESGHPSRELLTQEQYLQMFGYIEKVAKKWNEGVSVKEDLDLEWLLVRDNNGKEIIKLVQVRTMPLESADETIDPQFIGEKDVMLHATTHENPNSMFVKKVTSPAKITTKSFVYGGALPKSPFESFEMETPNGQWQTIQPDKFLSPLSDGRGWEGMFSLNGYKHQLHMRVDLERELSHGLFSADDYRITISAESAEFVNFIEQAMPYYWFLKNDNIQFSWRPPYVVTNSFANDEGLGFDVKGTSTYGGMDKTFSYDTIDLSTLKGFLDKDLKFTKVNAVMYAPAHHNFTYQYIVSLLEADDLTESDRAEIIEKNAQYLIIDKQMDHDVLDVWLCKSLEPQPNVCKSYGKIKIQRPKQ